MTLRTLLTINSFLAGGFGLSLIISPANFIAMHGAVASAAFEYLGQLFGTCLVGYAMLTWMARDAPDSDLKRALILSLVIADGSAFVIALMGQLRDVVNAMGWSTVAIHLFLALGFAYFRFAKPSPVPAASRPISRR